MVNDEQAAINRRQKIAELMMQQGAEPMEINQTAGGYVVPVSPLAGVAKVAQQLAGAYVGKQADKQQTDYDQKRLDELKSIDLTSQDAPNKLMALGRVSEALAAQKQLKEPKNSDKIPTGFRPNDDGSIAPMPIAGGGNFMDYQLQLANQKAQIPSYGEPERLQMAKEDQAMQREAMARAEAAAARQQDAFERQQKLDAVKLEAEQKKLTEPPKLTEAQAKAGTFASQMQKASEFTNQLESEGYNPSSFKSQLDNMLAGGAANVLASDNAQKYKQAQNQWAEAFLRVKTGAAATEQEVQRNIATFFPQVGDSAEVIKQKALARKQAEQDVLRMSGPAAQDIPVSSGNVVVDIKNPELLSPENKAALNADVANEQAKSGGLTPAEQAELEQLRARFGKK